MAKPFFDALQIAHLKCTFRKHEARKNKPNMSSKLCRVIQPLVVRSRRHLKVVTLNTVTDAENPAPGAETTGLRHLKLL